jgi:hypothetical protein
MIGLGLGLLLLSILFGGPALVAAGRQQRARQRAAAEARRRAEEQSRQRALDARRRVELIWRNSPDRAGVGEYLRYLAVRAPLDQAASEAEFRHGQRSDQVDQVIARYPGGRYPSTRYRLVVLAGFAFFLGVFALAITLDYLIFRGLHPAGTMLLPFALACLAVMGITVGSIILLGAKRHDLLPDNISDYYRQVIILGGGLLAACIAGYMVFIAPNRSYPAGEAAIIKAEQVLQADQSAQPPPTRQLLDVDLAAVSQARARLARAQQVDRLSAGALALVEIPLSEAGVLGGELLILYAAVARRKRARREHQRAQDAVARADARFIAELTQILISHGHNEESVRRIIDRVSAMNAAPNGRQIQVGGGPAGPASPGPPGPGHPGTTPPGPGHPGTTPPGGRGSGPAPGARRAPPASSAIPYGGPVPGGPVVNVVPGAGPVPGGPAAGTGATPEMASIVRLPEADHDQTE